MPRLTDDTMQSHALGGNFSFTGTRVEKLGASNYTLVTVLVDISSSVDSFADELLRMLTTIVAACRRSPMSENILLRVCTFTTGHMSACGSGVEEVHGFKPLAEIDPAGYQPFSPYGGTPLFDATYSALSATLAYAKVLRADDFLSNGIFFIITDGGNNASTATMQMIRDEQERIRTTEELESLVSVLVGINVDTPYLKRLLETFAREAGLTHFIDAGSATPGRLAKLALFVSRSVDSQSQALGTGGPSQQIAAVI